MVVLLLQVGDGSGDSRWGGGAMGCRAASELSRLASLFAAVAVKEVASTGYLGVLDCHCLDISSDMAVDGGCLVGSGWAVATRLEEDDDFSQVRYSMASMRISDAKRTSDWSADDGWSGSSSRRWRRRVLSRSGLSRRIMVRWVLRERESSEMTFF
jgi:hypothetical protein